MEAGRYTEIRYYPNGFTGQFEKIAGARTEGLSGAAEPVNTTDKQSGKYRTLSNDTGTITYDLTSEGVLKGDQLFALFRNQGADSALHDFGFFTPGLGELRCKWFISSFNIGAPMGSGERTFDATFINTGSTTWEPAT